MVVLSILFVAAFFYGTGNSFLPEGRRFSRKNYQPARATYGPPREKSEGARSATNSSDARALCLFAIRAAAIPAATATTRNATILRRGRLGAGRTAEVASWNASASVAVACRSAPSIEELLSWTTSAIAG